MGTWATGGCGSRSAITVLTRTELLIFTYRPQAGTADGHPSHTLHFGRDSLWENPDELAAPPHATQKQPTKPAPLAHALLPACTIACRVRSSPEAEDPFWQERGLPSGCSKKPQHTDRNLLKNVRPREVLFPQPASGTPRKGHGKGMGPKLASCRAFAGSVPRPDKPSAAAHTWYATPQSAFLSRTQTLSAPWQRPSADSV